MNIFKKKKYLLVINPEKLVNSRMLDIIYTLQVPTVLVKEGPSIKLIKLP